jgi:hypothetical protein
MQKEAKWNVFREELREFEARKEISKQEGELFACVKREVGVEWGMAGSSCPDRTP